MKFFRLIRNFGVKSKFMKHRLNNSLRSRSYYYLNERTNISSPFCITNKLNKILAHTNSDDNEELFEDFSVLETDQYESFESAREILFKDVNDSIIQELNKCVSVEEVLNLIKIRKDSFDDAHFTQTIFVLKDLQNMCHHFSSEVTTKKFVENLCNDKEFHGLITSIEEKLNKFDPKYLSYVVLYLNKLGIVVEEQIIQKILLQIRDHLLKHFSLDICSRFLQVLFNENSVRPYYMSLNLIPMVTSHIGECKSVDDLQNLTICLSSLHNIMTSKLLKKYREQVRDFIDSKKIKGTDYPVILKIISFLSFARWIDESVSLMSDCILLMKNEICLFNMQQIISLYEVFFKIQEPGEILSNMQRCSAMHLQRFESEQLDVNTRLKLFSSVIYFSSPTHRVQFRKDIDKYLNEINNYKALNLLRKIFSYVKISDGKLCARYWSLSLKMLEENADTPNIVRLCQNYMYMNTDIDGYRYYKFEHRIMRYIYESIKEKRLLSPSMISNYLSFAMVYGKSEMVLQHLIHKFEENVTQFNANDCLKISHSILLVKDIKDGCIQEKQVDKIKKILNRCSEELVARNESDYLQNNVLIKASILRNDYDSYMIENLLTKYKEMDYMSSKFIENICFILQTTDSLIPEVINKCTEYVIKHSNNMLGFNIEKLLFLCFHMAYYPINADKFFEVVIDIIIRDQERLSGLAFLQSALSLCYFHKLPSSFVKHIFNVEFMEKLDEELANCYSKDKYPHRVRNTLMQLNRAVCLEYPEYNVPWFHKKYLDELQKRFVKDEEYPDHFPLRIKEYLLQIVGSSDCILEDVITPYGYHIDFLINLNNKEEAVEFASVDIKKRVALLLMRQYGFTRFYTHLKGKYQLKKRHLEMLGYTVSVIKFNEWINLLYAEERFEYLSKMIWHNQPHCSFNTCNKR